MTALPTFEGLYFVVHDIAASLRFYRDIGFDIPKTADHDMHVSVPVTDGIGFAFGTLALTKGYNAGWRDVAAGSPNALQFSVSTRDAVDELYSRMTAAGHEGALAPIDAFWGSRYAELRDPDGNVLGFHSPRDPGKGGPPPGV